MEHSQRKYLFYRRHPFISRKTLNENKAPQMSQKVPEVPPLVYKETSSIKNLIFICVFHQQNYINLLKLLLTSIVRNASIDNTDILIITSPSFHPLIVKEMEHLSLNLKYFILDLTTLFDAGCARLNIFKYEGIESYDKIIYLDTDILINSDINILLSLKLSNDKIYTLEEGIISQHYYGSWFFDFTKIDSNTTAFTSGIMLFQNNKIIKTLFEDIQKHIQKYIVEDKQEIPDCLDQPFIVFNAITQHKYDNTLLKNYVENNPSKVEREKVIYHFPGGPGAYDSKFAKMTYFWNKMNS